MSIVSSHTDYILLMRFGIPLNPVRLFLQFLLSQTIVVSISTLGITQTSIHTISESLISLHILSLILLFILAQFRSLSLFYSVAVSTIDYSFTRSSQELDFILGSSVTILIRTSHTLALSILTHDSSSISH
jgi:hypothetical protein